MGVRSSVVLEDAGAGDEVGGGVVGGEGEGAGLSAEG